MARKLVEFNDVAAAAQKLKDAGKRPTVIAIRTFLVRGASPPFRHTSSSGQRNTLSMKSRLRLSCQNQL